MSTILPLQRARMARARERAAVRRRHRPTLGVLRRYGGIVALTVLIAAAMMLQGRQQDVQPTRSIAPLAVRAVDGDTLHTGSERIRLSGIDAPELSQTCQDGQARAWACGQAAKQRLAALVAQGSLTCSSRGQDRYGRTLAVCAAGQVADIGAALVRDGYAVNYSRTTSDYKSAEQEARAARRGIWQGAFEQPEQWRRRHRTPLTPTS
jgi:endonuclease YncB( thermonuclease family)